MVKTEPFSEKASLKTLELIEKIEVLVEVLSVHLPPHVFAGKEELKSLIEQLKESFSEKASPKIKKYWVVNHQLAIKKEMIKEMKKLEEDLELEGTELSYDNLIEVLKKEEVMKEIETFGKEVKSWRVRNAKEIHYGRQNDTLEEAHRHGINDTIGSTLEQLKELKKRLECK